jgi:hypothetical protein
MAGDGVAEQLRRYNAGHADQSYLGLTTATTGPIGDK